MGNQVDRQQNQSIQDLPKKSQSIIQSMSPPDIHNQKQLKTSGTAPNLHTNPSVTNIGRSKPTISNQVTGAFKDKPPISQSMTKAQIPLNNPHSQKNKLQIMSAMTSRVLQKEKQMSSTSNLHSFANPSSNLNQQSRTNFKRTQEIKTNDYLMNTTSMINKLDTSDNKSFVNNSEQVRKSSPHTNFDTDNIASIQIEPFQNISNRIYQQQYNQFNSGGNALSNNQKLDHSANEGYSSTLTPFKGSAQENQGFNSGMIPIINQTKFYNHPPQYNSHQVQPGQYGRLHSKSAHVAAAEQERSTEHQDENIDMYKMQQRLLRKLKNQRKKPNQGQNQQPKQKRTNTSQIRQSQLKTVQNENVNSMLVMSGQTTGPLTMRQQQSQKNLMVDQGYNPQIRQNFTPNNQDMAHSPLQKSYFSQQQQQNFQQQYQNTYSNLQQQRNQQQNMHALALSYQEQKIRTLKFGESGQIIPTDIVITMIQYDTILFQKFMMLSPSWHTSALQAIDEHCNKIENQFVQNYIDYFFFKQSYTQTMPIKFCGEKGLRLDRVIECELLANKAINSGNKTVRISCSYKVFGDKTTYKAEYKFDACKQGTKRLFWLHQDTANKETYTQPIQQVCVGDSIEFSVSLLSLQGCVSEIKWEKPLIQETPKQSVLNYDKDWTRKTSFFRIGDSSIKIYCDLNRICELEDAVVEWYEEPYYQKRTDLFDLSFLKDYFNIKKVEYAGVDGTICKINMIAQKEGSINKSKLGLKVSIKGQKCELLNEIKRLGYLKDRELPVQIRVGDHVIAYISKQIA